MKRKVIKNYQSDLDKFLHKFDKENPEPSNSQREEIAKHKRIAALRDKAISPTDYSH